MVRLKGDPALIMPECDVILATHFNLIGRCEIGANGRLPLSWREINAYNQAKKLNLSCFEMDLLRMMSQRYVEEASDTNANKSAPYLKELTHEEAIAREEVYERMTEESMTLKPR